MRVRQAIGAVGSHGLFYEQVLAGFQSFHAQLEVGRHGRGHHHGVNGGVMNDILVVGGLARAGVKQTHVIQTIFVEVGDGNHFSIGLAVEIPDQVRSPVPATDHTDSYHFRLAFIGRWLDIPVGPSFPNLLRNIFYEYRHNQIPLNLNKFKRMAPEIHGEKMVAVAARALDRTAGC